MEVTRMANEPVDPATIWQVSDGGVVDYISVTVPSGAATKVKRTKAFGSTVREIARKAGLKKFSVFVNGKKIEQATAPNDFKGLQTVEIKKYDAASF